MFCGNCGSQNPDGLTKCAVCGAPLTEEKKDGKAGKVNDVLAKVGLANADKNKLTGYAVIAAVALVVIILLIVLLSGRSDTATLKQYIKASYDLNGKKIVNLMPSASIRSYADAEDISKSEGKEELIDAMQELLEYYADRYDSIDWDDVKSIEVKIRKEDKYSKKQLREFNEDWVDEYDFKINAKEIKTVEVKVSGKYDGDKFSFTVSVTLIKIGSTWYIWDANPATLFYNLYSDIKG